MIKRFIVAHFKTNPELNKLKAPKKSYKRITKNTPKNIDLNQIAYKYFGGVDLMSIEGISHAREMPKVSIAKTRIKEHEHFLKLEVNNPHFSFFRK